MLKNTKLSFNLTQNNKGCIKLQQKHKTNLDKKTILNHIHHITEKCHIQRINHKYFS